MTPFIKLEQVSKAFGTLTVIDRLDLDIARGEFLSLLGPSGSGKTTILMMLAGFIAPTNGSIWLEGSRIEHLPPHRRNMGVVFQNYALFPHMTVAENVAFPLLMRGVARADIARRVEAALDMVKLAQFKDRKPAQLSGGQQQRVALTRALVFEPTVVLMDEPLGALDKQLREHMQLELRELHHRLGLTIVFVTHDQGEALTMSDRIAVFNAGRIEQLARPESIYDRPQTRFVAEFIGETNLLSGTIRSSNGSTVQVSVKGGPLINVAYSGDVQVGAPALISLRPEQVALSGVPDAINALPVTVVDTIYHGDHLRIRMASNEIELIAKAERKTAGWSVGAAAYATFDPDACILIAR